MLPGAQQTTDTVLRINGLPSSSQTIMVEGMDATNGMWRQQNQSTQQGTDAVQEVSVQTSNFAAEYGGAGGGYLNFTMKSGTNQYHGSAYDYFVNSALNAGLPFSANCNQENNCATNPNSGHIKNDVKRNDYGFTFGGPVRIPKIYNGKDKTFFFFNFEQFRQTTGDQQRPRDGAYSRLPNSGNFSRRPGQAPFLSFLNSDGAHSEPDLRSDKPERPVNGVPVGNPISEQRDSPQPDGSGGIVSADLLPHAQHIGRRASEQLRHPGLFQFPAHHHPVDQDRPVAQLEDEVVRLLLVDGTELARTTNGFSANLAPVAPNRDRSYTYRVNFDDTITPTLLFHFGVGLLYYDHPVYTPPSDFDAKAATAAAQGFGGAPGGYNFAPFPANTYMPSFGGLNNAIIGGGLALGTGFFAPSPGPAGFDESDLKDIKPTANTSITWVHGNHTYKAGADMVLEGFPQQSSIRAFGEYLFSGQQTENPAEYGVGGIIFPSGFAYASFLLGQTSSVETSAINDSRLGNHTFGAFIQDSWKVSRKLTLELGLRWDYATLLSEQYGRMSDASFQASIPLWPQLRRRYGSRAGAREPSCMAPPTAANR